MLIGEKKGLKTNMTHESEPPTILGSELSFQETESGLVVPDTGLSCHRIPLSRT